MSKKTKTQSTQNSTATVTPNNPTWVSQGLENVGGGLQKLMGMDPRSFVAGPSALQTKAFSDATNLTSSPHFADAGNIFKDVAGAGANTYDAVTGEAVGYDPVTGEAKGYTASSLLDGLDRYMSPYTNDVVNSALADFDYGAGQTRANQALDEARSGAFGGSGAAITRAMTEGDLARGRAATSANLRDLGFQRGTGLSFQDAAMRNEAARYNADALNRVNLANMDAQNSAAAARAAAQNQFGLANLNALNNAGQFNASARDAALARQLSAGSALAGLGSTMSADQRANIALTGSLGQDQRAIEQAQAAAPLSVLQQIAATYGGMPLNLLSGQTTTGNSTSTSKTSDPMSVIGTLGSLALAPFTGGASLLGLGALGGGAGAGAAGLGGYSNAALSGASGFTGLSDRRLKTDIEKVGERDDGLGVYAFRYLWSPVRHIGVMAQEVLNVKPEAVVHLPGGYMAVNYGAL